MTAPTVKVFLREQATPHRPAECGATGKVSLREQADEAQRELAMRHRVYPGLVTRGKMSAAESAVAIARMRAIRDTLRLFAEHEDAIRSALGDAIRQRRADAQWAFEACKQDEIEALRDDPGVRAVLDVFPDATVTGVTNLEATP
mgnify:CR=1 FL=1